MCPPPDGLSRIARLKFYWKNAVYRNTLIYLSLITTINMVLNVSDLMDACGL